jgi:plasmid maintenance system antidote protein VapI
MTLKEWLHKTNNTQMAVANKLHISTAQLNKFVHGSQVPTLFMAQDIYKLTKGKVTMHDWVKK